MKLRYGCQSHLYIDSPLYFQVSPGRVLSVLSCLRSLPCRVQNPLRNMTSMLLFFEFLACHTASDYRWGKKGLSDFINRKPVLLSGVLVFVITTILFGLSQSFWILALRSLYLVELQLRHFYYLTPQIWTQWPSLSLYLSSA